jgi:PST family polysaccharide transporter
MAVSLLSMTQGLSIAGLHAADFVREWRDSGRLLISLIADSWRYWLLALLAFVYTGLPVLLVAQLRGDADAGVLRVCLLLAAALEVIFASINSVLLPRLVRSRREGKQALWAQQRRQLVPHVLAGAAVFLLTCVAASPVFNTFLGAQFESGLWPFIVLALSRVVVFVGQIFVWGIVALRLDSALLGAVLCAGVVSVALNLALVPRYSIVGAALAALAAELVIACGCFIVQRRHLAIDGTE